MKNLKMLSLFLLTALFSCSDDDTNNGYVPNDNILNNWTLLKSTGTIAGTTDEFPNGTITWKFNSNNTVHITNNNENENLQSGLPTGTYSYVINDNPETNACEKKITINTSAFECLIIDDTQMDINEGIADGINYHFERVIPFTTN